MEWYTLRVISGKEAKICESIIINIEEAELKDDINEVLVPAENIVEMKDGKKKIKNKVFFPGYILIKMNLNNKTRYLVENINGVLSFVGPKGAPQIVKAEEMVRILGEVEGRDGKEVLSVPYRVGDSVKVTDGPFMDFSGFVQDVSKEKQKIKVSVSIFGRPTPIELDFLQVELEK